MTVPTLAEQIVRMIHDELGVAEKEAAIERVEALHYPMSDAERPDLSPWCIADGRAWPCDTIRALDGTQ